MLNLLPILGGLSDLGKTAVSDYIGPVFLVLLAIGALTAFWQKAFRVMWTLVGVGIIAAVLIFGGDALFGENGNLTKAGKTVAQKVNVALVDKNFYNSK